MTTAAQVYTTISRQFPHASWIANVLLTCSKPTTRLRNMLQHLRDGREFSPLSFTMPYEGFFVDGAAVNADFLNKKNAKPEDHKFTTTGARV